MKYNNTHNSTHTKKTCTNTLSLTHAAILLITFKLYACNAIAKLWLLASIQNTRSRKTQNNDKKLCCNIKDKKDREK